MPPPPGAIMDAVFDPTDLVLWAADVVDLGALLHLMADVQQVRTDWADEDSTRGISERARAEVMWTQLDRERRRRALLTQVLADVAGREG